VVSGTVAAGGGATATGVGKAAGAGTAGGGAAVGSFTGDEAIFGAGGGSGAEGSWTGAVVRRGMSAGGGTATGVLSSRGRKVMRTVSFFRGTAEVLGVLGGCGVLSSLMMSGGWLRDF
jgi:hypothetical protein